ncbi:hypothetical protein MMC07_006477 [Pseudocyphellaria aurata]|nr:hypothetical protein [Pseudocyphellaria aurata]
MGANDLPPAKRARTLGNATNGAKGAQDAGEESPQTANLVERRRLQNRISQQNYRKQYPRKWTQSVYRGSGLIFEPGNKIRVRLEKLEALVDANARGDAQASENTQAQTSTTPQPQAPKIQKPTESPASAAKSNVPNEQCDIITDSSALWKSIPNFLDLVECNEDRGQSPEMPDLVPSLGSSHVETFTSTPTLVDPVQPASMSQLSPPSSVDMYQSEDFNCRPMSSEADRKPFPAAESEERFFPTESTPDFARPNRPNFSPFGHYCCAGTLPMSPLSPLGASMVPFSPLVYPNVSVEEGLSNPTANHYWQGMPTFGSVHPAYMAHQPYVWVPVPVPVVGALPPEMAKPHQHQPVSLNGKKP